MSILIVMLSHSGLQKVIPGLLGVTIFFVISGFLITTLLLNELEQHHRISLSNFYIRRALRLYPPLLIYIFCMSLFYLAARQGLDTVGLTGALFYFANYLYAFAPEHVEQFGAHLWSLSVEEHFYLIFPFLFALGVGRRPPVLLLMITTALIVRVVAATATSLPDTYLLVATECRFDSILTGCLVAVIVRQRIGERFIEIMTHPAILTVSIISLLCSLIIRDSLFRETVRFSLQNIALMPVLVSCIYTNRYLWLKTVLNTATMRWVGVLSYSLYLWHFAIFEAVKAFSHTDNLFAAYAIGWMLSFGTALAIHLVVERPIGRLRRRFGSGAHEVATTPVSTQSTQSTVSQIRSI